MKLNKCSREQFVLAITEVKEDRFAKTFKSKADLLNQWNDCLGLFSDDGSLMGAIITTVGKKDPKVANLQLLHTFAKFRRRGVAKQLTLASYEDSIKRGALYFRVSAEPDAVAFYESIGFKFWGLQKSGCSLSIFRVNGALEQGVYNDKDPVIHKALYSGRKGSLASSYAENKGNDLSSVIDP